MTGRATSGDRRDAFSMTGNTVVLKSSAPTDVLMKPARGSLKACCKFCNQINIKGSHTRTCGGTGVIDIKIDEV